MSNATRLSWCLAALTALVILFAGSDALACSVCFDTNEERRGAFLATTLFLTLTPLAFVLGVFLFLRRRARDPDVIPPAE